MVEEHWSRCRSDYLYVNFFYINGNHIFYETKKNNPNSGHWSYLCRFEVVIFQAIQNMVF